MAVRSQSPSFALLLGFGQSNRIESCYSFITGRTSPTERGSGLVPRLDRGLDGFAVALLGEPSLHRRQAPMVCVSASRSFVSNSLAPLGHPVGGDPTGHDLLVEAGRLEGCRGGWDDACFLDWLMGNDVGLLPYLLVHDLPTLDALLSRTLQPVWFLFRSRARLGMLCGGFSRTDARLLFHRPQLRTLGQSGWGDVHVLRSRPLDLLAGNLVFGHEVVDLVLVERACFVSTHRACGSLEDDPAGMVSWSFVLASDSGTISCTETNPNQIVGRETVFVFIDFGLVHLEIN